jgi:N utilization substance protein B
MLKREQARVLALQALYQWDLRGEEFAQAADEFLAESTKDTEVYFFARELAFGAWNLREKSDVLIREAAAHWDVVRMAAVDRNILRLAVYEMTGRQDIPARVAIDQAIELAKRFGAAESGAFVNGILDHILRAAGLAAPDSEMPPAPSDAPPVRAPGDRERRHDPSHWDEE